MIQSQSLFVLWFLKTYPNFKLNVNSDCTSWTWWAGFVLNTISQGNYNEKKGMSPNLIRPLFWLQAYKYLPLLQKAIFWKEKQQFSSLCFNAVKSLNSSFILYPRHDLQITQFFRFWCVLKGIKQMVNVGPQLFVWS